MLLKEARSRRRTCRATSADMAVLPKRSDSPKGTRYPAYRGDVPLVPRPRSTGHDYGRFPSTAEEFNTAEQLNGGRKIS